MSRSGTIVEMNPAKGMFLVAIDGGAHAVFTLYDAVVLVVGDRVAGHLDEIASERLCLAKGNSPLFDAFGETGPCSLAECKRFLWA